MTDTEPQPRSLVLIDGYGFVFRAYHSLPPLTRPDGVPVGAVYGFTNMLIKLLAAHPHDHLAVIFDSGQKNFRHGLYDGYKANRPPAPEDLIPQFPLVREAVRAFNVPAIEVEGYEADDVIATYTQLAKARGESVIIVSSDKDLMQLVGGDVTMFDPLKSKVIDTKAVEEKFGVPPEKVAEVLALMGDSSDNIPGVPGIGPKTAAELIKEYGNVESVLAHTGSMKPSKRRQMLEEHKEDALLSKKLVALCYNVPVPVELDALLIKEEFDGKLIHFLQEQGFKSLVAKFSLKSSKLLQAANESHHKAIVHTKTIIAKGLGTYPCIETKEALSAWLAGAYESGKLACLFIPEEANKATIAGLALAASNMHACYVPIKPKTAAAQSSFFPQGEERFALTLEEVTGILGPYLTDRTILKIGHDMKALMEVFSELDIHPVEDVMLLSYVLSSGGEHALDALIASCLGEEDRWHEVVGIQREKRLFSAVEKEKACHYAGEKAERLLRVAAVLRQRLIDEKMVTVYETIERPLIAVLAKMEEKGVLVDPATLASLSQYFAERLSSLEQEIFSFAGTSFNIGSPKQLGEVLFEKMKIEPVGKTSKTGAYSTGAEVLEELAEQGHVIAEKLLLWRQFSKLKSTYADALANQINPETGRVHTHFSMAVTSTGRLSSTQPNLQNIPIRTEEGQKIRKAFVAAPGHVLLSADYSQIELRLLADMADIAPLKQAFKEGKDIHAITASQVLGIPLDQIDPLTRRSAKAINFGIIYGISAFGLARQLGISRQDAAKYIEAYFKQYPGIEAYMNQTKAYAREKGYVVSLFGRKCYVPGIHDKNPSARHFAERAAINAPLQGTAADIIKKAMIALPTALQKAQLSASMLLQVHDELLFEVPTQEITVTKKIIKKVMEHVVSLTVPLVVDIGTGQNWAEMTYDT